MEFSKEVMLAELNEVAPKVLPFVDVTWELLGRVNGISDPRRIRATQTLKTVKGPFHAVVSKSKFTMDIYFGSPGEFA